MNDEIHIMVDLETVSLKPNAGILQIAARVFNPYDDALMHSCAKEIQQGLSVAVEPEREPLQSATLFNQYVSYESLRLADKFDICNDTLQWWKEQDAEVYESVFNNKHAISIQYAFSLFVNWLNDLTKNRIGGVYLWSHGKDFDCVVLVNVAKILDIPFPIKFWNTRDTRTLFAVADHIYQQNGTQDWLLKGNPVKHDAFYDTKYQAAAVQEAYAIITQV